MDAVVVAQAFHWFDPLGRCPRSPGCCGRGGWLALIWNERDESDPVVAELVRISKWDLCQPYPMGMDFGTIIDESGLFGPVERTKFAFVQSLDLGAFVDQVASRSYVQVLPEASERALLAEVEAFGATLGEPIAMPYITDLFCARCRLTGVRRPWPAGQRRSAGVQPSCRDGSEPGAAPDSNSPTRGGHRR